MRYILIIVFILLLNFEKTFAKKEEICYLVEYFFLDVAKVCISYETEKIIKTDVKAYTIGLVKFFKNISYYGFSKAEKNFKPIEFYFNQKEKNLHIIHHYKFKKNFVKIKKVINKKNFLYYTKIKEKFYLEPFSTSLFLFEKLQIGVKEGSLTIFYNGKIYKVPFKTKKSTKGFQVEIDPRIEVEGIIKPRGKWYLYFKKKDKYPYKMELKIRIGEIKLKRIN